MIYRPINTFPAKKNKLEKWLSLWIDFNQTVVFVLNKPGLQISNLNKFVVGLFPQIIVFLKK